MDREDKQSLVTWLALFGLFFSCCWSPFFMLSALFIPIGKWRTCDWVDVPATLEKVREERYRNESQDHDSSTTTITVRTKTFWRYTYQFQGRAYTGKLTTDSPEPYLPEEPHELEFPDETRFRRSIEQHAREGTPVMARVNPREPARSFIDEGIHWRDWGWRFLAGLAFFLPGIPAYRYFRRRAVKIDEESAKELGASKPPVRVWHVLVGLAMLLVGLFGGLCYLIPTGASQYQYFTTRDWARVPARVWYGHPNEDGTARKAPPPATSQYASPEYHYTYRFKGREYVGCRVSGWWPSSDAVSGKVWAHVQNSRPVLAWVNPERPSEAILYSVTWGEWNRYIPGAIFFPLLGLGGAWYLKRLDRIEEEAKATREMAEDANPPPVTAPSTPHPHGSQGMRKKRRH